MKQVESTFPVKKTSKPNDQVNRHQIEIFKFSFKPLTKRVHIHRSREFK